MDEDERNWKKMFVSIQTREGNTFIQFLLDAGLDVNALNKYGNTMLSYAAECGNLEIVEFLVQKGADGNVANSDGSKPLHIAAKHDHTDIVKFFLNLGIFVDNCDNDKCTPLHYATDQYIPFGGEEGYQELVQFLVDRDADVNAVNRFGYTPLLNAARNFNEIIAELLIKSGANVEGCCAANQWTLLHYSCRNGWSEIVRSLVEGRFDIDLNAKNDQGLTPLVYAFQFQQEDVVKLLIESGADIEFQDSGGQTLLHYACIDEWPDVVKCLIEKASDLNAPDDNHDTPLHLAVWVYSLEIAECLLKAGVDCTVKNMKGNTAFNVYIQRDPCVGGIALFVDNGAYFSPEDYVAISETPSLKEGILQDVELCTQAVVNKFNNADLPKIYDIPVLAEHLPSIEKLKIVSNANVVQDIAHSVEYEIQTKGYCNVLNVHPIVLNSLCVRFLIEYYGS